MAGFRNHGNELSGFHNGNELYYQLNDYYRNLQCRESVVT